MNLRIAPWNFSWNFSAICRNTVHHSAPSEKPK
jgi:hypothetical protein